MTDSLCRCGSGRSYAHCCEPLHLGSQHANSAEQLMRSRFCAYALGLTDYIFNTTLPAQQSALERAAIEQWAASARFTQLQVGATQAGQPGDLTGQVEFTAQFYLAGESTLQTHHECSEFRYCNKRWYFLDPNAPIQAQRNSPCPCGSGRKFKKCCA